MPARLARLEAAARASAAGLSAAAAAAAKARLRTRLLARDVGPTLRAAWATADSAAGAVGGVAARVDALAADADDSRRLLVALEGVVAKQWAVLDRVRREAAVVREAGAAAGGAARAPPAAHAPAPVPPPADGSVVYRF